MPILNLKPEPMAGPNSPRRKFIAEMALYKICKVGHNTYLICDCDRAKDIRLEELGFSIWTSEKGLRELI